VVARKVIMMLADISVMYIKFFLTRKSVGKRYVVGGRAGASGVMLQSATLMPIIGCGQTNRFAV